MTQRRVENTRVHFWTFSPVSVKNLKYLELLKLFWKSEFAYNIQDTVLITDQGSFLYLKRKINRTSVKLEDFRFPLMEMATIKLCSEKKTLSLFLNLALKSYMSKA